MLNIVYTHAMQSQETPNSRQYLPFSVSARPVSPPDPENGGGRAIFGENMANYNMNLLTSEMHNMKIKIDDLELKMKRSIFNYVGEVATKILVLVLAIKVFGNF